MAGASSRMLTRSGPLTLEMSSSSPMWAPSRHQLACSRGRDRPSRLRIYGRCSTRPLCQARKAITRVQCEGTQRHTFYGTLGEPISRIVSICGQTSAASARTWKNDYARNPSWPPPTVGSRRMANHHAHTPPPKTTLLHSCLRDEAHQLNQHCLQATSPGHIVKSRAVVGNTHLVMLDLIAAITICLQQMSWVFACFFMPFCQSGQW